MSADELVVRLQAGRVWHCYECGDDMPAKYQRTHPVLCLLAARLAARKVELLLVEVFGD